MYMYLTVILPPTPFTGCSLSCVPPWTFPVPDNTRSQSTWPGTGGKWSLKTLMRSRISEASLQNGGHVCARQSHGVHVGELKGKKKKHHWYDISFFKEWSIHVHVFSFWYWYLDKTTVYFFKRIRPFMLTNFYITISFIEIRHVFILGATEKNYKTLRCAF